MSERIWVAVLALFVSSGGALTLLTANSTPSVIVGGSLALGLVTVLVLEMVLRPPDLEKSKPHSVDRGSSQGFGRSLLDRMPVPFLVINNRWLLIYANPAAMMLLPRLQPGQHLSTQLRAPQVLEVVEQVSLKGKERATFFALKSGPEKNLLARAALLPPGGDFGPDARVMLQFEDHTERHRAAEMRSDFIANASHELRTPLAAIIGYIETLRGHAKDDPEAQAHFLEIMAGQADRMQRLIEDLMWLSRIELTEHVPPETEVDLTDITRESLATLAPIAQAKGASLEVGFADTSAFVTGDRDQLTQVVVNLVDNAIKYGGENVCVSVSLNLSDERFPGCIGLAIEDNGPGIPREELPRLTERFYRISSKERASIDGTGLGLAIVKHILQRHSGELDIWSEQYQGSRFTIWLPKSKISPGKMEDHSKPLKNIK